MNLSIESCAFVLVDVQERLVPAMSNMEECLKVESILLQGAAALGVDTIVTEQYPQGLGGTLPKLTELLSSATPNIPKTTFSCFGETAFRSELSRRKRKSVVLFGIETHVCVLQTAMDLVREGYDVYVAADAVTSRKPENSRWALDAMRSQGVWVLPAESILFALMEDSKHQAFREIGKLVR